MGYFVTPIVNSVDPDSELGAAMFEPARRQIIDADEQYTRLDWEYEAANWPWTPTRSSSSPAPPGRRSPRRRH